MELFYCTNCFAVYLFNVYNNVVDELTCKTCGRHGPTFLEVQIDQKIKLYIAKVKEEMKNLLLEHRHQWDGMVVQLEEIRPITGDKK